MWVNPNLDLLSTVTCRFLHLKTDVYYVATILFLELLLQGGFYISWATTCLSV